MHANQTPVTTSPTPPEHYPARIRPVRPTATPAATDGDADAASDAARGPVTPTDESEEAGYGYGV